jgi:UDP-N-acetylglucosamine 2-epimerase
VQHVCRLLEDASAYRAMSIPALPFGDGKAAPRIAALCEQWLTRQSRPDHALIA